MAALKRTKTWFSRNFYAKLMVLIRTEAWFSRKLFFKNHPSVDFDLECYATLPGQKVGAEVAQLTELSQGDIFYGPELLMYYLVYVLVHLWKK